MSSLLDGGFDVVAARLDEPSQRGLTRIAKLYVWLCLIFVKTHLKDRSLQQHRDPRKGQTVISDQYEWSAFHHVHSLARIPYTEAMLDPKVIGTIRWFRVEDSSAPERFDYFDLTNEHTVALRLGDIGIVAVLNDACATSIGLSYILDEVRGKTLTMVQLRELAARLAMANRDLRNRPKFFTIIDRNTTPEKVLLAAHCNTQLDFAEPDLLQLGELIRHAVEGHASVLRLSGVNTIQGVLDQVATGRVSFLFNSEGKFLSAGMMHLAY